MGQIGSGSILSQSPYFLNNKQLSLCLLPFCTNYRPRPRTSLSLLFLFLLHYFLPEGVYLGFSKCKCIMSVGSKAVTSQKPNVYSVNLQQSYQYISCMTQSVFDHSFMLFMTCSCFSYPLYIVTLILVLQCNTCSRKILKQLRPVL